MKIENQWKKSVGVNEWMNEWVRARFIIIIIISQVSTQIGKRQKREIRRKKNCKAKKK